MVKIFVYGILVGRYENRQPAILYGFEKIRDEDCAYYSIKQNKNEEINGELIDVDQWHFEDIDNIEGFPHYYTRYKVKVEVCNDGYNLVDEDAWVYQTVTDFKKEFGSFKIEVKQDERNKI